MHHIIQIKLKSVTIIENGQAKDGQGNNILSATLVYPAPQSQSPTTVIGMNLEDKKTLELGAIPLKEQLVYKGLIIGESGIEVEITAVEETKKIESILQKVFGTAAVGALGLITGGGAIALVTAAAKTTLESVFDMAKPKDRVHIIGKGFMSLSDATPEGDFVVQLSVPKKVELQQSFVNEDGQRALKKVTLRQGYNNAMVVFDIKKYLIPPSLPTDYAGPPPIV